MRRPDVFTLDYSHSLAHGLVLAGLASIAGSKVYTDSSLCRGHGTLMNMVPRADWVMHDDIQRYALDFDATDDYVSLPGIDSTGDLTVSLWLHSRTNSTTRHAFQLCSNVDDRVSFGANTAMWFVSANTTASNGQMFPVSFGANRMAHYSVVKSAGVIVAVYGDGAVISEAANNGWSNPALGAYLGKRSSGNTVDGLIADFFVHNRHLSPAEIALLADRTDPMLGGLIVEERPVLYFDMGGSTVDALTASNLTVSAPVLGTPALGQSHALTASGITVEGPVLGAPALAQIHALTAQNFTASSPVLGAPAVGQVHALTANNLTVSSPVLGTPALTENAADVDALTANDLVVGSPAIGAPSLNQIHVIGSDGLVTGSPVLGSPTITQIHALEALGLTVGVPVLGTPALNGSDIVLIDADEVGRATTLQARNYRATLAKRNYTARL